MPADKDRNRGPGEDEDGTELYPKGVGGGDDDGDDDCEAPAPASSGYDDVIETKKNDGRARTGIPKKHSSSINDDNGDGVNDDEVDDDEDYDDDLQRQVEAIDREEAAVTPALQRTTGFTSTPGAFRASPTRGVRRAGADAASLVSAMTSVGDTSTWTTPGGAARGLPTTETGLDLSPPIEAILVDSDSAADNRRRRKDTSRLSSGGENDTTSEDDDNDKILIAEPLSSSRKGFVATTPRCMILVLAALCVVIAITASVSFLFYHYSGILNDRDDRKEMYKSYAVIFGSYTTNTSALAGCIPLQAEATATAATSDNLSSSMATMKICIACDRNTELDLHYAGDGVNCTDYEDDKPHERQCTIPHLTVSYVSFGCLTHPSPRDSPKLFLVRNESKAPIMTNCANDTTTITSNNHSNTNDLISDDSFGVVAFLHLQQVCSPTRIITDLECEGGTVSPLFGECTTALLNGGPEEIMLDEESRDPLIVFNKADCKPDDWPDSNSQDDRPDSPPDSPPDPEEKRIVEVILKGNVTTILDKLSTGAGGTTQQQQGRRRFLLDW